MLWSTPTRVQKKRSSSCLLTSKDICRDDDTFPERKSQWEEKYDEVVNIHSHKMVLYLLWPVNLRLVATCQ